MLQAAAVSTLFMLLLSLANLAEQKKFKISLRCAGWVVFTVHSYLINKMIDAGTFDFRYFIFMGLEAAACIAVSNRIAAKRGNR
ncbi:hypothetical protein [Neisseria chenwenguii]|uniref:Uncharacterized protein n=1 Tax=Neisseria chenwenguii TaxID=1853278 RepID=A0A220RYY0_9NEIS|nr:hypothetical protein [Neisseria chenwenguii]ASK26358.1 hypothetical protein BG910_00100 [Neisseria chenwenguii]ROV55780.1 hypothetical protein EGS38_07590 [Neisseria chenwenguii]